MVFVYKDEQKVLFKSMDSIHSVKGFKSTEKNKFPCKKCGLNFTGLKTLNNHKKGKHCEKCSNTFGSPNLLTDHMRVKHGENRVPLFDNRPASQESKDEEPVPGSHTTVLIAVPQTSGHWALGLGFQNPDPELRSPDTDQDQEMDSPPSSQQCEGVMVVDREPVSVPHITVPNVLPQTSGHWGLRQGA